MTTQVTSAPAVAIIATHWGGSMDKPVGGTESPGQKRRHHPRFGPSRSVAVSLEAESGVVVHGVVVNVSAGGANVVSRDDQLHAGEAVIAQLSCPSSPPVTAAARVVWSERAPEMGLTSYGLLWTSEGFQRERLDQLIRSLFPG